MPAFAYLIFAVLQVFFVLASPAQETFVVSNKPYDIQVRFFLFSLTSARFSRSPAQAHRGGRGNTVESTLPSFGWYAGVCDICTIQF